MDCERAHLKYESQTKRAEWSYLTSAELFKFFLPPCTHPQMTAEAPSCDIDLGVNK